jgi:hypothetical protein
LSYGALAAGIGGLVLILSLFLDWFGGTATVGFSTVDTTASAFDTFSITAIFLLLVGLLAVAFAALEVTGAQVQLPFNRVRVLTILGIISTSIVLTWLLESDAKVGNILALFASIAILAGGILAERRPNEGVDISNLGQGGGFGQPQQGGYAAPPQQGYAPQTAAQPAAPPAAPAPPQAPGQPADWYPDPRGQKRLRYWDGSQWTDHVAD